MTVLGGLAIFLYAMQTMTDALRDAAGDKMRALLSAATATPLAGALAGAVVTAALQSSSAVTVAVLGFVSAGLMDLDRAVPVIFGANVGTTITAQLLAFSLDGLVYPLLFVSFLIRALVRSKRGKALALAVFSFALLLEGIRLMGSAAAYCTASPRFAGLMALAGEKPLAGLALGASMTALTQSSSATVALLQRLAPGALGLTGAIPILLGCNIGTTVTGLIAAAGGSRDARRVALAHCIFNLTGAGVFLLFIPAFARLVVFLTPSDLIARQIANAHTLFNAACVIGWLPLTRQMVRLVKKAVPDGK